jgi:AcrR family transcriptional regulator/DNA-binding MarR family transcriptional regulator
MAASGRLVSRYPRRGGVQVSEVQRSRMLSSVVAVVSEHGYGEMSVTRVTSRAGVSRRTFYELFENREECFLAAFDDAISEMGAVATAAYAGQRGWRESLRAALSALLELLDQRPGVASLVIVQALGAGPKVLQRRAEVLAQLNRIVDLGRTQAPRGRVVPPLTAEGVVGAVLAVIHARLTERDPAPLGELLNPLMSTIVAPYMGAAAAARELERGPAPGGVKGPVVERSNPLGELNMRVTYRTLRVLGVIAEQPGASNRQIATGAEVSDQGQMSRLLTRLDGLGLIENDAPRQPTGEPNAWRLTPRGQEIHEAINPRGARDKSEETTR